MDVTFEIPMPPRGQGRPRAAVIGGHARIYKASPDRAWEANVASAARVALGAGVITSAVRLDLAAVMPRPKYMLARFARSGLLKCGVEGLVPCLKRPDASNVMKAVEDGMRACWRDDAQVTWGEVLKFYAEVDGRARVMVRVRDVSADAQAARYDELFACVRSATAAADGASVAAPGGVPQTRHSEE